MKSEDVPIANCLADWIDVQMPEVGRLATVRVRSCDMLPFEWLPGFMPNIAGITLWSTIYLKRRVGIIDPARLESVELLLHELVHVGQFRRSPILFPVRYLVELLRRGYWEIPAEVEARERAAELIQRYALEGPCRP